MNKKILLVLALLLLIGVGYFLWSKSKNSGVTQTPLVGTSQEKKSSSLKDLFTSGIAQSCSFDNEGNKGKVYFTSGKMRGDFETTTDSKTSKSHMLVDGKTSYIWMDGETTGFKMTFDVESTQDSTSTQTNTSGPVDLSSEMNYDCGAWVVDQSLFSLPSGATFQEFAVPSMPPSAPSENSGASSQCSYCDSLTGDSKTQCLSALKCN